jgi:hypothetical protein
MSNEWADFLCSELVNEVKGGDFALLTDLSGILWSVSSRRRRYARREYRLEFDPSMF